MNLLRELASKAQYRTDFKIPLKDLGPSLSWNGEKYIDQTNPTSELAYDLNSILAAGWVEKGDMKGDTVTMFTAFDAVTVTENGLRAVADADRSWLSKAIDKQPITFLQVVINVVIAVLGGIAGFLAGLYMK
jgi:hypothetical protein